MRTDTAIITAALALTLSSAAYASVYETSFENNTGAQTLTDPLDTSDTLVIRGMLESGAGSVLNETTFTVAPGTASLSFDAVWRSGNPGDTLRLTGVNIDLVDSSNTVVASDTFAGVLAGFAHSSLSYAGLNAGGPYTIRLTGSNANVGQYIVDATFAAVPLPGALSLLLPALVGLGTVGIRRNKDA